MKNWHKEATKSQVLISYNVCTARWGGGGGGEKGMQCKRRFQYICWFHGSSFRGLSIVFPAPWLAKVESSQKWNGMWFSRHFFAPYLFHRSRNNRRYKLHSKFWREKMFRKPHLKLLTENAWSVEPTIWGHIISTLWDIREVTKSRSKGDDDIEFSIEWLHK